MAALVAAISLFGCASIPDPGTTLELPEPQAVNPRDETGTERMLDDSELSRRPAGDSLDDALATLPGVTRRR